MALAMGVVLLISGGAPPARGQGAAPDTLLITPTMQGAFHLPNTGVTLEIAYATVNEPTTLTITRANERTTVAARSMTGVATRRFEMPLIAALPGEPGARLIGWPQTVSPPETERWLIVFDAHGIYAVPSSAPQPDAILYLGPLEHYAPDLIHHDLTWRTITFSPAPPVERGIVRTDAQTGNTLVLPTAARTERYRDRFLPEDLGNPGGFMLLGWAYDRDLPDLARALRSTIPDDPDLPVPGAPQAPITLILPFDCAENWVISWGYHHSTPQNRFAVDFAALAPNGTRGQPVYAAHAGSVYLKRYGTPDHMIDVGLAARVVAADAITSTVYGHLDPAGTFARWEIAPDYLPDLEWVEVGQVAQGQMIGVTGRTGYATGPHIHFALWSWDQSLYQPVPLGPLADFRRGLEIPAARRSGCEAYRR
jgi:murein DD-endopeptidase MepM/ murein hydrolase activator NlpD